MRKSKAIRFLAWLFGIIAVVYVILLMTFRIVTRVPEPKIPQEEKTTMTRIMEGDTGFACEHGWLRKAGEGWWLMHLEGSPYEIGYAHGLLTGELMASQERAFTERLEELIPGDFTSGSCWDL